ncbi:MAG: DUF177 domain-containing protein [Bacteroidales bacterium]|nr:DUF177 domain-containing protein [Bacteroidales bacterium]MBN2756701.1 DUF177 domain-containing protein [Bacteroidales bacterium]
MSKISYYNIAFSGLKEGTHNFNFSINKNFLENFQYADINDIDISVDVIMQKTSRNLIFEFVFLGTVNVQCDRCLDYFDLPIDYKTMFYVNFGDKTSDITDIDDTMILARTEDTINLAKHFYDYIILQIPIKIVHPDDKKGKSTCNIEMLERINQIQNNYKKESTDPRWDKLKNLHN